MFRLLTLEVKSDHPELIEMDPSAEVYYAKCSYYIEEVTKKELHANLIVTGTGYLTCVGSCR